VGENLKILRVRGQGESVRENLKIHIKQREDDGENFDIRNKESEAENEYLSNVE
jgi:hypothetical protein